MQVLTPSKTWDVCIVGSGAGGGMAAKVLAEAGAEVVLLDNFSTRDLSEAVRRVRDRAPRIVLEASGGVTLDRIREIAKTGVDVISIGAITHSARAVDFSFSVRPAEAGRGSGDR